jgi:hypothetical protein
VRCELSCEDTTGLSITKGLHERSSFSIYVCSWLNFIRNGYSCCDACRMVGSSIGKVECEFVKALVICFRHLLVSLVNLE